MNIRGRPFPGFNYPCTLNRETELYCLESSRFKPRTLQSRAEPQKRTVDKRAMATKATLSVEELRQRKASKLNNISPG